MTTRTHPVTAETTIEIRDAGDTVAELRKIVDTMVKAVRAQRPNARIKVKTRYNAPGLQPVSLGDKRGIIVDALVCIGVLDVPTLCAKTPSQIEGADGIGPAGLRSIRFGLYKLGLQLKDDAPFPVLIDSLSTTTNEHRQLLGLGILTVAELKDRHADPAVANLIKVDTVLARHRQEYPEHYDRED